MIEVFGLQDSEPGIRSKSAVMRQVSCEEGAPSKSGVIRRFILHSILVGSHVYSESIKSSMLPRRSVGNCHFTIIEYTGTSTGGISGETSRATGSSSNTISACSISTRGRSNSHSDKPRVSLRTYPRVTRLHVTTKIRHHICLDTQAMGIEEITS